MIIAKQNRSESLELDEPPYDREAEAAVLACLLVNPALTAEMFDRVRTGDFWGHRERKIFEAMQRLHNRGVPIDVILLAGELEDAGQLDRIGDRADSVLVADLRDLALHTLPVAFPEHLRFYVDRLQEVARRRRARLRGLQLIEAAHRSLKRSAR
jgi:replicative DNA helicase